MCAIARFLPLPLLLLLPDNLTQSEEERPADEEKSLSGNPTADSMSGDEGGQAARSSKGVSSASYRYSSARATTA